MSGLLGEAEHSLRRGVRPHITLTGSLRNALLRDVDDKVHTEVHRLPGGRVSTKVHIGAPSNPVTSRVPSDTAALPPPSRGDFFDRHSTVGGAGPRTPSRLAAPSRKRQRLSQSRLSLSGSLASGLYTFCQQSIKFIIKI